MSDLVLSKRRPVAMTYGKAGAQSFDDITKDTFDIADYWQRTMAAGNDAHAFNENALSASVARKQAFQERIDAIKAATGETLDNPLDRSVIRILTGTVHFIASSMIWLKNTQTKEI